MEGLEPMGGNYRERSRFRLEMRKRVVSVKAVSLTHAVGGFLSMEISKAET